jgi:hypothetical protein
MADGELEADDALASAARLAAADPRVERVCIWTPDKDLAQCVVDGRVVQVDRRSGVIRDASGVRREVRRGSRADTRLPGARGRLVRRLPGHSRHRGRREPQRLIARHGPIEAFPDDVLGARRDAALLFKRLATLRADEPLFTDVDSLRWRGVTPAFDSWTARIADERLARRAGALRRHSARRTECASDGHRPAKRQS